MVCYTHFKMRINHSLIKFYIDNQSDEISFQPIQSNEAKLILKFCSNYCSSLNGCIKWWCPPSLALFSYSG